MRRPNFQQNVRGEIDVFFPDLTKHDFKSPDPSSYDAKLGSKIHFFCHQFSEIHPDKSYHKIILQFSNLGESQTTGRSIYRVSELDQSSVSQGDRSAEF